MPELSLNLVLGAIGTLGGGAGMAHLLGLIFGRAKQKAETEAISKSGTVEFSKAVNNLLQPLNNQVKWLNEQLIAEREAREHLEKSLNKVSKLFEEEKEKLSMMTKAFDKQENLIINLKELISDLKK